MDKRGAWDERIELEEYVRCVSVWLGAELVERVLSGERIGFGFPNPV